jgi:hypothetical protein
VFPLAQAAQWPTTADVLLVISAVTVAVTTIIHAWGTRGKVAETKVAVNDVMAATKVQDVQLKRIETLGNGQYGAILQRLADVERLLATESGRSADAARAESSQKAADTQAALVADVEKER